MGDDFVAMLSIQVKLSDSAVGLPQYAHGSDVDAGMDLLSSESVILIPWHPIAVPTGLFMAIPSGFMGEIRTRSSLALKGVVVSNSPGTVDPGYRGEILVILLNQGEHFYDVKRGDKIAQLVIVPYQQCMLVELPVDVELPESSRGEGGFGSTGR